VGVFNQEIEKEICEDVLQEVINQIQGENRNPAKCEIDGLAHAVNNIRFGSYALPMENAAPTFAKQQ
jgi:hypothetical protein